MRYDYVTEAGKTVSFDTVTGAKLKKYEITIANHSGELDRQVIEVPETAEDWQLTHYVCEAIKTWTLADGDVIRIREWE
jgi:hypothetical protein